MSRPEPTASRRDVLKALLPTAAGSRDHDPFRTPPAGGATVRLSIQAMACDFAVIMNPGASSAVERAGRALELVPEIESWLSIYRADSEISRVNQRASSESVQVSEPLFGLLEQCVGLHARTEGAFDVAAGRLAALWKSCRRDLRLPTSEEIAESRTVSGTSNLELNGAARSVRFLRDGLSLDPGAIGKGFALDRMAELCLEETRSAGSVGAEPQWPDQRMGVGFPGSYLLHSGHSSLLARGQHAGMPGWPVGLGNPLFTSKRLGTILLCDQAMSTSGSNIQYFRLNGRRYGHLLDPRTGWPVDDMLSVTVVAASAAVADALSTAFFVLGLENARRCCENMPGIGAILIPLPRAGHRVEPVVVGIPPEQLFWSEEQVILPDLRE